MHAFIHPTHPPPAHRCTGTFHLVWPKNTRNVGKAHPTRKTREQKTRVFLQKVEHHSPYTEPKLEFWAKTRVFRLQKSTTWQTRNVRLSTFATKKSRTFIIDFFGNPKSKPAWRHPKKAGLSKLENFLKNSSFPCRVEVFQSRKKKSDQKSRVFTNSTFFPCRVGLSKFMNAWKWCWIDWLIDWCEVMMIIKDKDIHS